MKKKFDPVLASKWSI